MQERESKSNQSREDGISMSAGARMTDVWRGKRLHLYWANRKVFSLPGLHLWTGKQHIRLLPVPKRGQIKANLLPDPKSFKNSCFNGAKLGALVVAVVSAVIFIS